MKKLSSFIFPLTIAFLITVIIACAGHMQKYRGKTVDRDSRIELLEEGSKEGIWQPFDLTFEYQYERKLDMLKISGNVKLTQHYTDLYGHIKQLYFDLYFLDKEGKILEYKQIVNAISKRIDDRFSFKQKLTIPPDTVFITFGYWGNVGSYEGGDDFLNYPFFEKHSLLVTPDSEGYH